MEHNDNVTFHTLLLNATIEFSGIPFRAGKPIYNQVYF